jgi:hypothetical protein
MSPIKPNLDRLVPALRRAASRMRPGHAVALSAVAAATLGLAGLRAVDLPSPRPITEEERLRIEVVRPVEPDIVPGSVMDVGELVDGFQGLPPPLPSLTDVAWSGDDGWNDDWDRDFGGRSGPRRVAEVRAYDDRAFESEGRRSERFARERASPVRAVQRWFGFDAPRRDFRAERAARRARMEAMEREVRERYARERYAAERFRRERAEDERDHRRRAAESEPPWRRDDRPPPRPVVREYEPRPDWPREEVRRPVLEPPPAFDKRSGDPGAYAPEPASAGPRPYDEGDDWRP